MVVGGGHWFIKCSLFCANLILLSQSVSSMKNKHYIPLVFTLNHNHTKRRGAEKLALDAGCQLSVTAVHSPTCIRGQRLLLCCLFVV